LICRTPLPVEVPVLALLEEYAGQNLLHYLAGLTEELERSKAKRSRETRREPEARSNPAEAAAPDESTQKTDWQQVEETLSQLKAEEVLLARSKARDLRDERERELHLVRLSQLKKFFQSDMFIDIARRESLKRFSEPLAAGAAAFAALWAVLFQRWADPSWVEVGFRGAFVLSSAIAFYVLRDRLKEIGREFITRKLSSVVPDVEQDLVAEGSPIGRIAEWFGTKRATEVPPGIRAFRFEACLTEAEKHLPEDVLHYRRAFVLGPKLRRSIRNSPTPEQGNAAGPGAGGNSGWALLDVQRINLERHLKHLDDPYKSYRFLDDEGNFSTLRSHRVYHFYACVSARTRSSLGEREGFERFFRIVMDKNGIDRVERI
jgi:hypothetical protein